MSMHTHSHIHTHTLACTHIHICDLYSQGSAVADTGYFEWEPGWGIHETESETSPSCCRETNKTELIGWWRWNSRDIEEGTQRVTQSAESSQRRGFHKVDSWFNFGSLISLKVVSCRPSTGPRCVCYCHELSLKCPHRLVFKCLPQLVVLYWKDKKSEGGASGWQKSVTRDRTLKVIARALVQCLAQRFLSATCSSHYHGLSYSVRSFPS